jgi:hypothetical protein
MSVEETKTNSGARLWDFIGAALIVAVGLWWHWPTWLIVLLVAIDLVNPAERWKELLNALRGSRKPQEESEEEVDYDRQIELVHSRSEFKHIQGLAWGDPSSYVKPSILVELERNRQALEEADSKRDSEAREFLNRETERVLREGGGFLRPPRKDHEFCLCGIPNCEGHKASEDGYIEIRRDAQ